MKRSFIIILVTFTIGFNGVFANKGYPGKMIEKNCSNYESLTFEQNEDPYLPFIPWKVPVKYIRVAFHAFQHSTNPAYFRNQPEDLAFFNRTIDKINELLSDMPPLTPEYSSQLTSPHITDSRIRLYLDTVYFHQDDFVYEVFSQEGIVRHGASHAHYNYVLNNPELNDLQRDQTLHIIVGGDFSISGGQVSGIGNKDFILFKAFYNKFAQGEPYFNPGIFIHEIGHTCGLHHHYGPNNCRQCHDLGCYPLGETNNIMALRPSELVSLSECQVRIMHRTLDGRRGNISDAVIRGNPFE